MSQTKKVATLKLLNEIQCVVIGLRPEEYGILYEQYGMYSKGYHFSPMYKLKKWDGKIRFFTKHGATFNELLNEIVPTLIRMGYSIKLIDKRIASSFQIPLIAPDYFAHKGITLGDHQVEALHALSEKGNGIILAGTGAGKTIMTAGICDMATKYNGAKNIVIVPNKDLIEQTILELREFDLLVGEYSGTRKNLNGDTVVSTWQALQHNPTILGHFNSLIVDECHLVTGKVLQGLLGDHAGHIGFRVSLTGTLHKDEADRMTMRVMLGNVLYEVPAKDLIASGWLARLRIKMRTLKEDLTKEYDKFLSELKEGQERLSYKKFLETYLPDYDTEKAFISKRPLRNEFIADFVHTISQKPKGNTFVLVKGITQGKLLASLIPGAVFVYGQDKANVRKKIYAAFADNDNLVVISTYQLASTGLNIKRMFNLVMVDAGKSFTVIIQTIGRALRKAHDKDSVTVYDFYSNMKFSRRHANERKKYYDESGYEADQAVIDYEALYKEID